MPFYQLNELEKKQSRVNSKIESGAAPGEFMKFGIVTKPEGEGPPLHEHPNEEQFTVILSGQMHFVLGDEDRVVGPGTLIHIPRNTRHRSGLPKAPCGARSRRRHPAGPRYPAGTARQPGLGRGWYCPLSYGAYQRLPDTNQDAWCPAGLVTCHITQWNSKVVQQSSQAAAGDWGSASVAPDESEQHALSRLSQELTRFGNHGPGGRVGRTTPSLRATPPCEGREFIFVLGWAIVAKKADARSPVSDPGRPAARDVR